jgi:peptidoglycan/LPS O-acetylase OafA/YrhL
VHQSSYRDDIQILRAIAVAQVVLFHIGAPMFTSGFLGVDIFFVISGYLMATISAPGDDAIQFYTRRARRLLPAYVAVVACTLTAAFFVTAPGEFRQVGAQTLYASTLTSNIGFALQNSYFSKSDFNVFLHLWSLAVECQFYLLFPFLILGVRRWRWFLPLTFGLSLIICLAGVLISPKLSFFMLPTRIWEFAIGIWAAGRGQPDRGRNWVGPVALAAMVVMALIPIEGRQRDLIVGHPALAAVLVCIATAIALVFRQPPWMTATGPARAAARLGDISYSLYLAHWPVLVLLHYRPFSGTQSAASGLADAAASLSLVAVSTIILYRACERPGPKLFTPRRVVIAACALSTTALVLPPLQLKLYDPADRSIFAATSDRATYRCGKLFRLSNPGERLCPIGVGDKGTVLLIGNSFSDSIKRSFAAAASRAGYEARFSVDNQPLITNGLDGAWLAEEVRRYKARAVFLHYSPPNLQQGVVAEAEDALRTSRVPLVWILPPPAYPRSVPQLLYEDRHGTGSRFPVKTLRDYRSELADEKISITAHTRARSVDIAASLCDPNCRVVDDAGRPLYFDRSHLTLSGAAQLSGVFDRAIAMVVRSDDGAGPIASAE